MMRAHVKKWGNSAAVRLPAAVMAEAGLDLDQAVDVRTENGRIVIEPIRAAQYDLAALVAGITPENLHAETAWGANEGREIL